MSRRNLAAMLLVLALLSSSFLNGASAARADLILQPAAASTTMGSQFGGSPNATRNQSGLSAGYTSLVTDFDAYIASNPTNSGVPANGWFSTTVTGNFDYDLGGSHVIQSFALWNLAGNGGANLIGFTLQADSTASFSAPVPLGSFTANPNNGGTGAALPEVFAFAPTTAAFVRLVITSNFGFSSATSFNEGAFEVQASAVPESGWIGAVAACGLVGVALVLRRRG